MKRPTIKEKEHRHFIENIILEDLESGKIKGAVLRFPPEPNGHLHIGHAKAICVNFGLARDNNWPCHLRMDDTNPEKEESEYIESIKEDVKWLGFDWGNNFFHASDYFDQIYLYTLELIKKGLAYVDSQSADDIKNQRGSLTEGGNISPFRNRTVEENLKIFTEMKDGKYPNGAHVLRAKIDMSSPNMNLRDPVLYRIKHSEHPHVGNKWCIYPMYDYTHPISDALEHITHSLCTLEFEDHRPLYDWCINHLPVPSKPRQIEFARLNLNYTVTSKRKLLQLVKEKYVEGWDDPRLNTIKGLRRRGVPPEAIVNFCDYISVGKKDTIIDYSIFENYIRDYLNKIAKRYMGVVNPLKVEISNWEESKIELIDAPLISDDESAGSRNLHFGKYLYIEQDDFLENPPPPKKWFRLGPGRSVRLRYGPIITVDSFEKDSAGQITLLKCSYVPGSFKGASPEGAPNVKGIIHWVNQKHCVEIPARFYDRLFTAENPDGDKEKNFLDFINPQSLKNQKIWAEAEIQKIKPGERIQLERIAYFVADEKDSKLNSPVLNRTATLKDTWKKMTE